MEFSLSESLFYAEKGKVKEWVHEFLNNEGSNVKLSEIMKKGGCVIGPVEVEFKKMRRICGPEKNMKFREEKNKFDTHVNNIAKKFNGGWDMPPLIVWYSGGKFSIADGSHRIEALKKLGFDKYFTVVWFERLSDFK